MEFFHHHSKCAFSNLLISSGILVFESISKSNLQRSTILIYKCAKIRSIKKSDSSIISITEMRRNNDRSDSSITSVHMLLCACFSHILNVLK